MSIRSGTRHSTRTWRRRRSQRAGRSADRSASSSTATWDAAVRAEDERASVERLRTTIAHGPGSGQRAVDGRRAVHAGRHRAGADGHMSTWVSPNTWADKPRVADWLARVQARGRRSSKTFYPGSRFRWRGAGSASGHTNARALKPEVRLMMPGMLTHGLGHEVLLTLPVLVLAWTMPAQAQSIIHRSRSASSCRRPPAAGPTQWRASWRSI